MASDSQQQELGKERQRLLKKLRSEHPQVARVYHGDPMNSLEGILDELPLLLEARPEEELLIAEVLFLLPRRVRERVLHSTRGVTFVVFSTVLRGETVPFYFSSELAGEYHWFIFLRFRSPLGRFRKRMMTTIAHEIAHFILRHASGGTESEKEADKLCQKWGFGRAYRNYDGTYKVYDVLRGIPIGIQRVPKGRD